jgi:serine O-acetyltransferase
MESRNKRYWPHARWGVETIYQWSHAHWKRGQMRRALALKYLNIFLFRTYIDCPARIGARLDLPHGGFGVVIGPEVRIGEDAILLHNVTIGHARPGPIVIGDRFCAGAGATILGRLTIGDDVTIGANATVNFDVPTGATVVGQKARVILPPGSSQAAETPGDPPAVDER